MKKSCQKVAEQLVERSTGAHPGGHQHGDRKPTETSATGIELKTDCNNNFPNIYTNC